MDINPPELNEPILQPGVRSMDMKNPEIIRTRDGSNLRISNDLNELEINKFQPRIQNLEKVGDLEILEEELLIDMNHVEINKFRIQDGIVQDIGKISPDFQFKAQDHDGVEYLDKHEIGEINKFRIQDGIVLDIGRISPDFQFKTQDLERVGYRENLGENAPLSRLR